MVICWHLHKVHPTYEWYSTELIRMQLYAGITISKGKIIVEIKDLRNNEIKRTVKTVKTFEDGVNYILNFQQKLF